MQALFEFLGGLLKKKPPLSRKTTVSIRAGIAANKTLNF